MFKTYYDYTFNASEFDQDFDSIFSSEISDENEHLNSQQNVWYQDTLKDLETFTESLLIFEKFFKKNLASFEWDPKKDFYVESNAPTQNTFPEIRIYTKKQSKKLKEKCKIKFKNSLVYHDTHKNEYYTDFYLKVK